MNSKAAADWLPSRRHPAMEANKRATGHSAGFRSGIPIKIESAGFRVRRKPISQWLRRGAEGKRRKRQSNDRFECRLGGRAHDGEVSANHFVEPNPAGKLPGQIPVALDEKGCLRHVAPQHVA